MRLISDLKEKYREEGAKPTVLAARRTILEKSRLFLYQMTRPEWLKELVAREYHRHYVHDELNQTLEWRGYPLIKCAIDLYVYQEILHEVEPDVILECGTHKGGSALFFADMCDAIGNGSVVTVDIDEYDDRPEHDRITYVTGSSIAPETVEQLSQYISHSDSVMVILDSDHTRPHVKKELEIYSEFVTNDSYLIVEDTDINGHPVRPWWGDGPMEAVEEFLPHNEFEIDRHRERFGVTFAPSGFLRKVK